jgi:hypothetical protein
MVVLMGLSISFGIGWRDGEWVEEADWRACRDGGWDVDCRRTSGGGRGEYVSDIFVEPPAVESSDGEAGGCGEDAGAEGEA